jgi:hypothetical protein
MKVFNWKQNLKLCWKNPGDANDPEKGIFMSGVESFRPPGHSGMAPPI